MTKVPRPADSTPMLCVQPPDHSAPLYLHRRSAHLPPDVWRHHDRPIPASWLRAAHGKGFRINRRIRDRNHVALECQICGAHTAQKRFTLFTAQPRCGNCAADGLEKSAERAGLVLLRRDPEDRHYGIFRAPCGHELRRQFELINRVADGKTGLRCETCHGEREAEEARSQGWTLLGPDPSGDPNYRAYRHHCGHEQRVARANMQTGRFDCGGCGETWASKPSQIYLAQVTFHRTGLTVVKLGYSANPELRFRQQLGLAPDTEVLFLRRLRMATGQLACATERAIHARLKRDFPDQVIPPDAYEGHINVTSEIYCPSLLPEIHRILKQIETAPDATF